MVDECRECEEHKETIGRLLEQGQERLDRIGELENANRHLRERKAELLLAIGRLNRCIFELAAANMEASDD